MLDSSAVVMIMVFGGFVLAGMIAIIGGFLHHRRERLLTHAERMKALEVGRDMSDVAATALFKSLGDTPQTPEEESGAEESGGKKSLPVQCFATTGWVSGLGLLFACWAGAGPTGAPSVAYAIAASAGAIGVTGMICGTILASKTPSPAPTSPSMVVSKSRYDPEAVGSGS